MNSEKLDDDDDDDDDDISNVSVGTMIHIERIPGEEFSLGEVIDTRNVSRDDGSIVLEHEVKFEDDFELHWYNLNVTAHVIADDEDVERTVWSEDDDVSFVLSEDEEDDRRADMDVVDKDFELVRCHPKADVFRSSTDMTVLQNQSFEMSTKIDDSNMGDDDDDASSVSSTSTAQKGTSLSLSQNI